MRQTSSHIRTLEDLLARDDAVDRAVCGCSLAGPEQTRLADQGAHDPTPTPYFILQQLFSHFSFGEGSHLLDVGCGTGRVLAHFLREGYPGRATGIELDPELAACAAAWARRHDNLRVVQGDVLDLDLSGFTDFYLFNPFDAQVLVKFICSIEAQVRRAVTVVHMSDNGDTWWYQGRSGWSEVASGRIQHYANDRGYPIEVYEYPQHYTVWRYDPISFSTDALSSLGELPFA